jgi:hypothetical protein
MVLTPTESNIISSKQLVMIRLEFLIRTGADSMQAWLVFKVKQVISEREPEQERQTT